MGETASLTEATKGTFIIRARLPDNKRFDIEFEPALVVLLEGKGGRDTLYVRTRLNARTKPLVTAALTVPATVYWRVDNRNYYRDDDARMIIDQYTYFPNAEHYAKPTLKGGGNRRYPAIELYITSDRAPGFSNRPEQKAGIP